MKRRSLVRAAAVGLTSVLASQAVIGTGSTEGRAAGTQLPQPERLAFDVAESMPKFVYDEAPVLPSGMPAYGNPFMTQGYIYPHGTLQGTDGVLADGSPEYPDKVIGEWTCRGYFIADGAETVTGPWVITTQLYDFYDAPGYDDDPQPGSHSLVTEGYEIADTGVVVRRAVTGGTERFSQARGEAMQTLLGFNAGEGVNLRFDIHLH